MPRKETKTIKIYRFAELSEEAKQRAKDDYARDEGYSWHQEALESMQALARHFGGRIDRYEIDYFRCSHSSASFEMPDLEPDDIKELLDQLGTFNAETLTGDGCCEPTGFCHDESAIDGFRIAFMRDGERDLEKLMDAAFVTWLKAVQDDCEWQYSDEQFAEHCEANDYEFTEDGAFYR